MGLPSVLPLPDPAMADDNPRERTDPDKESDSSKRDKTSPERTSRDISRHAEMELSRKLKSISTMPLPSFQLPVLPDIEVLYNTEALFPAIDALGQLQESRRELLKGLAFPSEDAERLAELARMASGHGLATNLLSSVLGTSASFREFVNGLNTSLGSTREALAQVGDLRVIDGALLRTAELRLAIAATSPDTSGLERILTNLESASHDVWEAARDDSARWVGLPRSLKMAPALHLFEAAQSTAVECRVEPGLVQDLPFEEDGGGLRLEQRLSERFPALVPLFHGAQRAIQNQRPDWVRQASSSMRQLLMDLIVEGAPDSEVERWNPQYKRTDDGAVSYEARIGFILRRAGSEYHRFGVSDNKHIRQTIIALNKAVHRTEPAFQRQAFRFLWRRFQLHVAFFLDSMEEV